MRVRPQKRVKSSCVLSLYALVDYLEGLKVFFEIQGDSMEQFNKRCYSFP